MAPRKHLSEEKFNDFLNNHFASLVKRVNRLEYIGYAILAGVVIKLIVDFFWG